MAAIRERHGGRPQRRVDACLDTLMGKRRVYHSQPTWMYFPELPAIEFFDRSLFPWLEPLEAASDEIRTELMRVLVADREGMQPYIESPDGLPIDQFKELNRSRKCSAHFLWNQSHTRITNTRCTVHLPPIVPPNCGFRVGSTTREWIPGQAWVFDDTIEHKAWNLSDTTRTVLIFDIWNPLLTAVERYMM